jgi:hypothetical protein
MHSAGVRRIGETQPRLFRMGQSNCEGETRKTILRMIRYRKSRRVAVGGLVLRLSCSYPSFLRAHGLSEVTF